MGRVPTSRRTPLAMAAALAILAAPGVVHASGAGDAPLVSLFFSIVVILVAGRLGGDIAVRLKQPEVLGELLAGVVLGNLSLVGIPWFAYLRDDASLTLFAGLGVVLLLFEVGLESTLGDMMKVGASSLLVAILGVVTPFFLGWGVSAWLQPHHSLYVHIFIGATLCATSVGITARVLQELNRSREPEARIILGAAVIDDVMGLVILAVVTGLVAAADRGESLSVGSIGLVTGKALGFLFGALLAGRLLARPLFLVVSHLRSTGLLLMTALGVCFLFSAMAGVAGLAPIVGAFAAGLLLEDAHFKILPNGGSHQLEELTKPIVSLFAPFFFVQMGTRVDLATFGNTSVLGFAAALTLAAIVGKQACAFGVLEKGLNRLAVGLGMIPRGEVGLIFAQIGHALTIQGERVIDDATFSAVVIMVIVTTVVTPGALSWALARSSRPRAAA